MKTYDVLGVGNALVDISLEVGDDVLEKFGLSKGIMHLVESDRQQEILDGVEGCDRTTELGGSALNVVRILASLGSKTAFVGMVGGDDFGARIRERMGQLQIQPLLATADLPTGSCVVLVTPDGERTMNTHLGTSRLYNESHIPHEEIARANVMHIEGYQWDTDDQKKAIELAIQTARRNGTRISIDVADPFAVGRSGDDFRRLIDEGVDVIFANEEEARMLYDCTPEETAQMLADKGTLAVVKLGAKGAILQTRDEKHLVPAAQVEKVVDTNGAGDIFASGFLYGLTRNRPLPECGRMAAELAADVIRRVGVTVSEEALARVGAM